MKACVIAYNCLPVLELKFEVKWARTFQRGPDVQNLGAILAEVHTYIYAVNHANHVISIFEK